MLSNDTFANGFPARGGFGGILRVARMEMRRDVIVPTNLRVSKVEIIASRRPKAELRSSRETMAGEITARTAKRTPTLPSFRFPFSLRFFRRNVRRLRSP